MSNEIAPLNSIRVEAIKQTALTYGAQNGLAKKNEMIREVLAKKEAKLNRIFNFNLLLLNHSVLPPVIDQAINSLNLDNPEALRTVSQHYKIVQEAKFVTTPPSWRDYLWVEYQYPQDPHLSLVPKNAGEREIWDKYVKEGWRQGLNQAEQIFQENLSRLNRDYSGMLLYNVLLAKNMISPPRVATANLGITGDEKELKINDQITRITSQSAFKIKQIKDWKPIVIKITPDNQ